MKTFEAKLHDLQRKPGLRRWLFVPYDQLTDEIGPLSREPASELGVVLVESRAQWSRRPYHKHKIAFCIANMRHFALEQSARGVAVRYMATDGSFGAALGPLVAKLGPIRLMEPAERELRVDIQPLVDSEGLDVIPHEGWLTTREQFVTACSRAPFRMDQFYRLVRKETGVLMDAGKPIGGRLSFDVENRLPWKGDPPAPTAPSFPTDPIKEEAAEEVNAAYGGHYGEIDLTSLPATKADAEALWEWAKCECLPHFGPYEDAMSARSSGLFHTRVSALVNVMRLLPARLVDEVEVMDLPLQSKEGFIRQVLGWREYVHHVHRVTDGFRQALGDQPPSHPLFVRGEDGASPCALGCDLPLPPAWWGAKSGLNCLDTVVAEVWREAYSHHITRLMVLGNIAQLLDVSPRELTDWFWAAYSDAWDWVVEPNVLGMGTYAVGNLMMTKPYVAGGAYINRMSNYCDTCRFDPKRSCPLTPLYWAFLARHEPRLRGNPRMATVLASVRRRPAGLRERDRLIFEHARRRLTAGQAL